MKIIISVVALLVVSAFNSTVYAGVNVLDFDDLVHGEITGSQYFADYGVQISGENLGRDFDYVVAFDTTEKGTRDSDLEFYNTSNDYLNSYTALEIEDYKGEDTPGNVLILQENANGCSDGVCNRPDDEGSNPAGYFQFNFSTLVDIISLDTFDIEDNGEFSIQFFAGGILQTTITETDAGTGAKTLDVMYDGEFVRQLLQVTGIDMIRINLPGSGAIDNLAFRTIDVSAPASLGLLSLALLMMIRRSRKS